MGEASPARIADHAATADWQIREIYSCRQCEHDAPETPVVTARCPRRPGLSRQSRLAVGSGLFPVAKIWARHTAHRQEQAMDLLGVTISRQTLANWMIAGADWLELLYDHLHEASAAPRHPARG